MTDTQLLSLLVALGVLVNVYGLILIREVHRITNQTLLTTQLTLDAVGELLTQFRKTANR